MSYYDPKVFAYSFRCVFSRHLSRLRISGCSPLKCRFRDMAMLRKQWTELCWKSIWIIIVFTFNFLRSFLSLALLSLFVLITIGWIRLHAVSKDEWEEYNKKWTCRGFIHNQSFASMQYCNINYGRYDLSWLSISPDMHQKDGSLIRGVVSIFG